MVSLLVVDGTGAATLNVSRPVRPRSCCPTIARNSNDLLPTQATLRYQSPLSNTLSTLSPLSLLSLRSADVQRLSVPLVESAVLRSRRTGQLRAELEMGRKDAHSQVWRRGEVGEVQVYDARLVFEARMKGLRCVPDVACDMVGSPIDTFPLYTATSSSTTPYFSSFSSCPRSSSSSSRPPPSSGAPSSRTPPSLPPSPTARSRRRVVIGTSNSKRPRGSTRRRYLDDAQVSGREHGWRGRATTQTKRTTG